MSIMAARSDRALTSTCQVVVDQALALAAPDSAIPASARVRLLVLADDVLSALGRPTNARNQNLASLLNHRTVGSVHLDDMVAEFARTDADTVGRLAGSRVADLDAALAGQLPVSVSNQFGNSRLVDYLRATLVELCVLAQAGDAALLRPAALRMAVRTLSQALGERFAGQTIEVRIPPASAVQVGAFGEGPTHTRGTPPNVVETDEVTWLLVATGRLPLARALDEGRATASGSHHQALERMLPVLDLRAIG